MQFEKHLFISYAHIDNLPLSPEQQGWISRFHSSLEALLSMRIGRKAEIWRDSKLAGNDIFGEEIISQFPKTAVLLSVLSPRYLASEWCTREVQQFCKSATESSGLSVGNKSRIVKIIKSPIDRDNDSLPEAMRAVLGYQFYDVGEDNIPLELDPAFGQEMAQKYNVRVAKLAWEIAEVLKQLAKSGPLQQAAFCADNKEWRPTVYLAECSYDQRDAREAIEAELKCHGYRVLPDSPLPRDESAYIEQVKELLKNCQLSIHLVGNAYGAVPDGPSEKSIVVLQNELATQCSRDHGLRRIVWLPEAATTKQPEPKQSAFILKLKTDAEAQFGADLITSNEPEVIKGAIHATLDKLAATMKTATSQNDKPGEKLVYVICDQRDRTNSIPLRRFLRDHGFDVEIPVFEGYAATVRQANQELLQRCGGVLVFYGEGGEAWRRSVEIEVRKFRAGGAASVRFPAYTYLAGPETEAKRDLVDLEETKTLNCLAGFSEAVVLPFTQAFDRSES